MRIFQNCTRRLWVKVNIQNFGGDGTNVISVEHVSGKDDAEVAGESTVYSIFGFVG